MNYKKTIILIVSIMFLCVPVNGATYVNGTLELSGESFVPYAMPLGGTQVGFMSDTKTMILRYSDESTAGTPIKMVYDQARININAGVNFADVPQNVGGPFILYDSSSTQVGTGMVYFEKFSTTAATVTFYFDDNFVKGTNVRYEMLVYVSVIRQYYKEMWSSLSYTNPLPAEYPTHGIGILVHDDGFYHSIGGTYVPRTNYYYKESIFKNSYSIKTEYSIMVADMFKNCPGYETNSNLIVKDENLNLYYETGYDSGNTTTVLINDTYSIYIKPYMFPDEYLIFTNADEDALDVSITLVANDSYEIGDIIHYDYTYINKITDDNTTYKLITYSYNPDKSINILRPLQMSDYTGRINMNSVGMTPDKVYYCVIDDTKNYNNKNIFEQYKKLVGFYNLTYDYEYINDTCIGSYCQYNVGDQITFVYNALSNCSISILDNDDTLIYQIDNISGFGTITYDIPVDSTHLYSYPGWQVVMNTTNTDDFEVYWYEIPEENYYDTKVTSEEIQENLDELKEGLQPLKDLMFGLTGIIVDNPDYEHDGIVDSNDMDRWFNSLIPLIIVIVLFIFYKGLKER